MPQYMISDKRVRGVCRGGEWRRGAPWDCRGWRGALWATLRSPSDRCKNGGPSWNIYTVCPQTLNWVKVRIRHPHPACLQQYQWGHSQKIDYKFASQVIEGLDEKCNGLNWLPSNSYVEALTHSTLACVWTKKPLEVTKTTKVVCVGPSSSRIGILIRGGAQDTDTHRLKTKWRHTEKTAVYRPRRETSERLTLQTLWSWASDLQHWESKFLLFEPPYLWCFVTILC